MISLLLASSLIAARAVAEYNVRIHNANELIRFSNHVNHGVFYRGTKVYLEADIDLNETLSQEFTPIGNDSVNYFPGVFDGQGHTIRGLTANTSSNYAGLFGYSAGLTVRNVVIDSFPVQSSREFNNAYVGGIIGYCYSSDNSCRIENNVVIGSVTYDGGFFNESVYIGGIVGKLSDLTYGSFLTNCANYGSVAHRGSSKYSYIGGIIGYATYNVDIHNCINYGSVTRDDTTLYPYVGGIVGRSESSSVENCVCMGSVASSLLLKHIGSIAGHSTYTSFAYCYWSEDIPHKITGRFDRGDEVAYSGTFDEEFYMNETVAVGKYEGNSLLDALNAYTNYHIQREYSRWALNKEPKNISFTVNGENILTLDSQLILLPSLKNNDEIWFDGWYTDEGCTVPLVEFEINYDASLYGMFRENMNRTFTITFDTRGGSPGIEPVMAQYLEAIELPRYIAKEKYEFLYWETEDGEKVSQDFVMPSYNITLYAKMIPVEISSAEDLIAFSNAINSGISIYENKTVYLDNDIEFTDKLSKEFFPIGRSISNYHFSETFDGRGHVIRGLTISLFSDCNGLFGYSEGLTIKNVVIDDSCSMTFDDGINSLYAGPVIGRCLSKSKKCEISGCVSMMNVETTIYHISIFQLGGIAGYIGAEKHKAYVRNCVNYGYLSVYVIHSYTSTNIGGIVGQLYENSRYYTAGEVRDCINYGDICIEGHFRPYLTYVSGIVGNEDGNIINSTNYGTITMLIDSGAPTTKTLWGILGMLLLAIFIL